jgi:hypothetical protein
MQGHLLGRLSSPNLSVKQRCGLGSLLAKSYLCPKGHFTMNIHSKVYNWQVFQRVLNWLHYWDNYNKLYKNVSQRLHSESCCKVCSTIPSLALTRTGQQKAWSLTEWVWITALSPTCFFLCSATKKNGVFGRVAFNRSSGNLGFLFPN